MGGSPAAGRARAATRVGDISLFPRKARASFEVLRGGPPEDLVCDGGSRREKETRPASPRRAARHVGRARSVWGRALPRPLSQAARASPSCVGERVAPCLSCCRSDAPCFRHPLLLSSTSALPHHVLCVGNYVGGSGYSERGPPYLLERTHGGGRGYKLLDCGARYTMRMTHRETQCHGQTRVFSLVKARSDASTIVRALRSPPVWHDARADVHLMSRGPWDTRLNLKGVWCTPSSDIVRQEFQITLSGCANSVRHVNAPPCATQSAAIRQQGCRATAVSDRRREARSTGTRAPGDTGVMRRRARVLSTGDLGVSAWAALMPLGAGPHLADRGTPPEARVGGTSSAGGHHRRGPPLIPFGSPGSPMVFRLCRPRGIGKPAT